MSARKLPKTTARVRVFEQSWRSGKIVGEVDAGDFTWSFQWNFQRRRLILEPSRGRALIQEPLGRFLEACDYQLEPGGDYFFTVRARL